MTSYRSKTALIYDHGQFVELAIRLRKDFGRVLYYAPWESALPTSNALRVGDGIRGIERVREIWSIIDDVDLFVFPDVYEGALQEFLARKLGKRVWGGRLGEDLELDRIASKQHLAKVGVDIGPYDVVTGLAALRRHLKSHDDVYVKVSTTRGDMETFHAPDYAAIEPYLDKLEHSLGARKKVIEFVVETAIPDAVEVGYDGYSVDGKFPKRAIVGVEAKDEAYACTTMPYRDLPDSVRGVNDRLAGTLKAYGYRGFISTEVRATDDGHAFLIDPCCRCGSPPTELTMNMVTNLADVIWEGAGGVLVDPEIPQAFGAQLVLYSEEADADWQPVEFPKGMRDQVKLRNLTMVDGQHYVIPQGHGILGAVVATGATLAAAVEECKALAEEIKGFAIEKPVAALDRAADDLDAYLEKTARPKGASERKAEGMARAGRISERALERVREQERV